MRYRTTVLLGAFLLFQVQPQIARAILPWFGGGPAVWSACLLFFQVQLVAGYAYAHVLHRSLAPRAQAVVHMALLAASLLFLPIVPAAGWQPTGAEDPTLHILLLLFATVGLPYLLLAATGPLLQAWFAREFAGRSPYRLYALSNIGSLLALLSFPFVFEPILTIGVQANVWALAYVAFFLSCGRCAWSFSSVAALAAAPSPRAEPAPAATPIDAEQLALRSWVVRAMPGLALEPALAAESGAGIAATTPASGRARAALAVSGAAPGRRQRLRWTALAALPSVMLLAVTNVICIDVAVIPFFWVMPLSVYLLTFVLTFDGERWYRPAVMGGLLCLLAVLVLFSSEASWFAGSVAVQATAFCSILFLCGMVCHGELVRQKPAADHLTGFYLAVSAGGAVGGAFVALIAPAIFDTYLEVELGLGACAIVGVFAWARSMANAVALSRQLKRRVLPFAFGIAVAAAVVARTRESSVCIDRSRNFYGRITVQETIAIDERAIGGRAVQRSRKLRHGGTLHGEQITGDAVEPGMGHTYFGNGSGVAYALRNHPAAALRPLRVGIVGLGTGTLASYARPEDRYSFYELDPAIVRMAQQHFTYLADARGRGAEVDIRLGDARIRMARELGQGRSQQFDVLVVDAFSSDAIPVHLLTREAGDVYWRQLAADGVLLVHVSNRLLDLVPVVRGLASAAHKQLRLVSVRSEDTNSGVGSAWTLVTDNAEFLAQPRMRDAAADGGGAGLLWTDDFSSLWHVVR